MNYCLFTKNACGTDTWPIGRPCTCSSCQQWLRSSMTFGLEQVVDSVLSEGTPTTATEVQTVVLKVAIAAFHLGDNCKPGVMCFAFQWAFFMSVDD